MLVSDRYKLIFIHIPKAAGSSLNCAFMELDPELRMVAGISVNGQKSRLHTLMPRSAFSNPLEYLAHNRETGVLTGDPSYDTAHPYHPLSLYLGGPIWHDPSYFSAAIVRNPFARLVSAYKYAGQRRLFESDDYNIDPDFGFESFEEFCQKYLLRPNFCAPITRYNVHFLPQYRFIYDGYAAVTKTKPFVDFVGKVENINHDFTHICKKIGVTPPPLRHVRSQNIAEHYSAFYSDESRKIVEKVYAEDLALFGYGFEDGTNRAHFDAKFKS